MSRTMNSGAIHKALKIVFEQMHYRLLVVFLFFLFFLIYVSTPVFTIPGNSYEFFFAITSPIEITIIALLSLMTSIIFTMQIYCWRNKIREAKNLGAAGTGTTLVGFFSSLVSTIFASVTCASCVSALFSFLGFGGMSFLLEHRIEITIVTTLLVLASLYLTSKRISGSGVCTSCTVE